VIAVVKVSGELEIGRRDEVRASLSLPPGSRPVLIDLTEVTYADSTAIAELLRFHAEAAAANVPVAILIGDRRLSRLFAYAGLSDAFEIFDDRASGLTYLAGRRT
jgi:anti-anti-sigma factor